MSPKLCSPPRAGASSTSSTPSTVRPAGRRAPAKRILDAVAAFESDGHQVLLSCVLGHKADLGVMALGPDLARIQAFEAELAGVGALRPVYSYLSLTELSEYRSTEDEDGPAWPPTPRGSTPEAVEERHRGVEGPHGQVHRGQLHPRLPRRSSSASIPCRSGARATPTGTRLSFEDRRRLMGGHARVGMGYAGRILQLITGSFAFDDWEWGVTLLADDPVALKDILYEMRFDEVSALYGEFGPFLVGLLYEPAEALAGSGSPGTKGFPLYKPLLVLHVASAIACLGPTYLLPMLARMRGNPFSAQILQVEALIVAATSALSPSSPSSPAAG